MVLVGAVLTIYGTPTVLAGTKNHRHKTTHRAKKKHRAKRKHRARRTHRAKHPAKRKSTPKAPALSRTLAGAAGPSGPSGQPMPVGNLPGWNQVFADDFSADPAVNIGGFSGCSSGKSIMTSNCSGLPASVSAKWWTYPDGWTDTAHTGIYEPSQTLSIGNGTLNVYLHSVGGTHMGAALVPKIPGGPNGNGQIYGRYEVRFRADQIAGYKTAWMLWPDSNVSPRDGEIDFPEADLNTPMIGYLHHQGATVNNDQDYWPTTATYNSWHTATITRMPGYVQFALDGNVIGTSTSRLPNTPMHWILQSETSTYGVVPANSTNGWIQIAWVTAYAPTG